MLSKSEDDVITERLKNWGRAIADHPYRRTSPLYWLRLAAAVADGSRSGGGYIDSIDWKDAEIINTAWRKLPERPERYRKAKRILALWYAYPGLHRRMVSRILHIPDRHLEFFLAMGKEMLYQRLESQDVDSGLDKITR